MSDTRTSPLIFGIYPGGHTGFGNGRAVTADDPARIHEALDRLQGVLLPFWFAAIFPISVLYLLHKPSPLRRR